MTERQDRTRSPYRPVAAVAATTALVALVAFGVAYGAGVSVSALTRDVVATQGLPWYVGGFSWLGVMVWFGGSAVAFAASWLAQPPHRGFLRAFGVFGMVLALDDGFALHDYALAEVFGDRIELVIYALYAAAGIAIALRWWRTLTPTALGFAVVSLVCLGASVLGDVAGAPAFAEDGLKMVGIAAWAGLAASKSAYAVEAALRPDTRV